MGVGLYCGSARLHGLTHSIRFGLGGSNAGWVWFVLAGGVRVCHLDITSKSVTSKLFSVDDLFLWRLCIHFVYSVNSIQYFIGTSQPKVGSLNALPMLIIDQTSRQ